MSSLFWLTQWAPFTPCIISLLDAAPSHFGLPTARYCLSRANIRWRSTATRGASGRRGPQGLGQGTWTDGWCTWCQYLDMSAIFRLT